MKKTQRGFQVGIQPIDLQTIYAQMEKVGKQQGAEQSAAIANRERQEEANKLDAKKRLNSVKDAEGINNDKITINENTRGGGSAFYKQNYKKKEETENEDDDDFYIKDPKLGSRVDISG